MLQSIKAMPSKGKPWAELEGLLKEYAGVGDPQKRQNDGKVGGNGCCGRVTQAEAATANLRSGK